MQQHRYIRSDRRIRVFPGDRPEFFGDERRAGFPSSSFVQKGFDRKKGDCLEARGLYSDFQSFRHPSCFVGCRRQYIYFTRVAFGQRHWRVRELLQPSPRFARPERRSLRDSARSEKKTRRRGVGAAQIGYASMADTRATNSAAGASWRWGDSVAR